MNQDDLKILLNLNITKDNVVNKRSFTDLYNNTNIYRIDSDNNKISYSSVIKAIEYLEEAKPGIKFNPNQIISSAKGERAKVYGNYWSFSNIEDMNKYSIFFSEESKINFLSRKKILNKKIVMFDRKGKPLIVFDDIVEAIKHFYTLNEGTKYPDTNSILGLISPDSKSQAKTCFDHQWDWFDNLFDNLV